MFFRLLYDERLAQASYIVACPVSGQALVVDPERDVDRYIQLARQFGLKITAVAETHIHADFLSGSRELAYHTGATVYLSGAGTPEWQYEWAGDGTVLLRGGESFRVGTMVVTAWHTPGHTPEHLSFTVTDAARGATVPLGMFTGDFLFVGDVGRPDLLETAVGQHGAARPSAEQLFESLRVLERFPDFLQIWPGHGAGSACGKAMAAIPQSTLGYERLYNPALQYMHDREGFIRYILSSQPEPPLYFARMKRENRRGPRLLGNLPNPPELSPTQLLELLPQCVVVDTRPWELFRHAHLQGALYAPLNRAFPTVVASYVEEGTPVVLILSSQQLPEAVRMLIRVGVDNLVGFLPPQALEELREHWGQVRTLERTSDLSDRVATGDVVLVDVRSEVEYRAGHIPGALWAPYVRLPELAEQLPRRELIVYCQSGERSAYAAALLQRLGFPVWVFSGGIAQWVAEGRPVERV
jgi:hydroxyacylglutathione hydrolase